MTPKPPLLLTCSPRQAASVLGGLAGVFVLLHLVTSVLRFEFGHESLCGFVPMFNLDEEHNLPTFFSSTLLLTAALLLGVIAGFQTRQRGAYAGRWTILSLVFAVLAIDEASGWHELISFNIKRVVETTGFFFYAWVIPGSVAVLVFAVFFWKFLWHLPAATRRRFVWAAVTFVAGALGLEFLGGRYFELHGRDNLPYALMVMCEEGLEMVGVVIFLYALLNYIADHHYRVLLQVVADRPPGAQDDDQLS